MRIIADFHDEPQAREAREEFERVFAKRGVPNEIPEHRFELEGDTVFLPRLLTALGLAASKSEASRLLDQNAVSIDSERLGTGRLEIPARRGEQKLIRVGKRRFARVTFT